METDREESVNSYVQMEDPLAEQIAFVQVPCPGRAVLHVNCADAGELLVKFDCKGYLLNFFM